jgi:hypothetical protein
MGQDSPSVLQKAGFSVEEIQLLEEEGIIYTPQIEEKVSQSKQKDKPRTER